MLIDWFTVIAQALNFLLLIWLLKRFLYQPILSAIDAREKRISDELADADVKRAEAQQEREIYQQKNQQFDQLRSTKMNKLNEENAAEKARLLGLARQESDQLRNKLAQALQDEQQSLQGELRDRVQQEIFDIARQTLSDLADVSLEARIVTAFIGRLDGLSRVEKASLQEALLDTDHTSQSLIMVQSAFDLSASQKGQISEAIEGLINGRISIRFLTAPELISGIEMKVNGQKIAWSIEDYLATLTQSVNQLMLSRSVLSKEQMKEPTKEQGSHEKHF